ncbi:MAG TPA: MFS transporter [Candidatus Baltobacteraceae bacterium]|nr:MFS transporter [Candidatus Baltobacteraceae bacterium]
MSREFAAYFFARQTGLLAFSIEDVAVSWQIFQLRHNPLDLGLVGLVLFLPQLLLALPAGILADRADRRIIVIASSFTEALGLAGFIALILLREHSVGIYLGAVAFIGIAHSMGIPAQRSLLVNIVEKGQLVRAQALTSSIGQLVTIGGPALGGALIAIGTSVAFAASALAYVVATLAFTFLQRHVVDYEDVPVPQAAMEGVRFIFRQRIILGAISLDLFAVLFGGAVALLPVFATNVLHVGPTGFGILRAAPAAGAALVAGYVARHSLGRGAGRLLLVCVSGFGAATIVFGISRSFIVSVIALALTGAFDMVSVVIRNALVQLRTPDEMRGRVGAVENVFIGASNELGAFESGGVAALIGAPASVVLGGIATLAVIGLWSVLFPELRQFEVLENPPAAP